MGIVTILAIYLVVWWLVLFTVLPWGVRGQAEEDDVVEGSEPGAPVKSAMWRKAGWTTVIAAVLTALIVANTAYGWLSWRDIPFVPQLPESYD